MRVLFANTNGGVEEDEEDEEDDEEIEYVIRGLLVSLVSKSDSNSLLSFDCLRKSRNGLSVVVLEIGD